MKRTPGRPLHGVRRGRWAESSCGGLTSRDQGEWRAVPGRPWFPLEAGQHVAWALSYTVLPVACAVIPHRAWCPLFLALLEAASLLPHGRCSPRICVRTAITPSPRTWGGANIWGCALASFVFF